MALSLAEVEKVARLSRLDLTDSQKQEFTRQLGVILEHIRKLESITTDTIEPMSHPFDNPKPLRVDQAEQSSPQQIEAILKNAPARSESFFKVPKVIE